jgi:hypothetical protein
LFAGNGQKRALHRPLGGQASGGFQWVVGPKRSSRLRASSTCSSHASICSRDALAIIASTSGGRGPERFRNSVCKASASPSALALGPVRVKTLAEQEHGVSPRNWHFCSCRISDAGRSSAKQLASCENRHAGDDLVDLAFGEAPCQAPGSAPIRRARTASPCSGRGVDRRRSAYVQGSSDRLVD